MRRPLCYICVAFVVSAFFYLTMCPLPENTVNVENGSRLQILGKVYQKEYRNQTLVLYLNEIQEIHIQKESKKIEKLNEKFIHQIICYMEEAVEPRIGSYVCLEGYVKEFERATNPGEFDQEEYYRILGIELQIREGILLQETEEYSIYRESLYCLRQRLEQIFEQTLSEKDAAKMKAMVLGNKQELDRESKLLFQQSGIAHILAISGVHISILGMGLYRMLKRIRIPIPIAAMICIFLMIAYGDMVGMSSSAYRAIMMFAMNLGAKMLKRSYDMLTALAVAAMGILIEQPLYLFHAGFLLSFGAILGIGYVSEVFAVDMTSVSQNKQKNSLWIMRKVLQALSGSLGILLVQLPILLCFYYQIPVYASLVNLLVIPIMSVLMMLGIVCLICGLFTFGEIGIATSHIAAFGCHVILWMFENVSRLSLQLPWACWTVGRPETIRIVIYYSVILLLVVYHQREKRDGGRISFRLRILLVLCTIVFLTGRTYGELVITMLDVGQGDGIWIETERGKHYLIDCGSTSESKLGQYTLLPFLKYTGTHTIDAVFVTHLDDDHISGIESLLQNEEGIRVKKVILSQAVIKDEVYHSFTTLCEKQGVAYSYMKTGDVFKDGKMTLTALHPDADYQAESRNAYSLVLKLEYDSFHALFTGDVEEDAEETIAEQLGAGWQCHAYKVSHHGSKYSNSKELIDVIRPKVSLISCAEKNSYGHPHTETMQRLQEVDSQILQTAKCGAITIHVKQNTMWIETYIK